MRLGCLCSKSTVFAVRTAEQLYRRICRQKFACAKTKYESVVTNVCIPWVLEGLKNYLKYVNFVSASCDASNHEHVKQFPMLVRYFQVRDLENPVKNELLTCVDISGETTDIISMQVMKETAN